MSGGTIEDEDTTTAPTAANDSYETPEGQALRVAAPGVLGNDTDPDSDALTAVEVTDPARGEVFVRADAKLLSL